MVGVVLYGVRNILSPRATEIFHFGGHNGGLYPSRIGKFYTSPFKICYCLNFNKALLFGFETWSTFVFIIQGMFLVMGVFPLKGVFLV